MVLDVRVYGDWAIASLMDSDLKETKITGAMVKDLKKDQEYVVTGVIRQNARHGESLELTSFRPHVALNERAIVRFLAANFEGVGQKSAAKYVEGILARGGVTELETFRQQLLAEPWAIDVGAINKNGRYSPEERDRTTLAFIQRDLATKLVGIDGIRAPVLTGLAKRLAAKLPPVPPGEMPKFDPVATAWGELVSDPYEPIASVPGYGFVMADTIGRQVGIAKDAPQRLAALVAHAVREGCNERGHVYLGMAEVRAAIAQLDPTVALGEAIDVARESGTVAIDDSHGLPRVYPFSLLKAEESAAARIAALCIRQPPLSRERPEVLERKIQSAAKSIGGAFLNGVDPSQLKAIVSILTSPVRVHTLTAEPGAGKTAVMEVLTKVLQKKEFQFCAPTGQAAKVLSSRLASRGYAASTIHSLLQGSGPGDFAVNEKDPLPGDILVVDESSMPDIAMTDAVLRAMNPDMHVLFVGDPEQLQSIDPGRSLQDMLAVPEIDHNVLTHVHRNDGDLLEAIRQVKRGELQTVDGKGVRFSHALPNAEIGFAEVVARYTQSVSEVGYASTGLLMSRKKGDAGTPGWNTTWANSVLREVCNPNANKVPGTQMFVNDRIIVRENLNIDDERVVNGDTGTIVDFKVNTSNSQNKGAEFIVLRLDDGRTINFPGASANSLQHSYALTVHSTQGSQYKNVIMAVTPGRDTFINRTMLYTGFSRARQDLVVYGDDAALKKIAKTPAPTRNSGLVERVRNLIDEQSDDEEEVDAAAPVPGERQSTRYGVP